MTLDLNGQDIDNHGIEYIAEALHDNRASALQYRSLARTLQSVADTEDPGLATQRNHGRRGAAVGRSLAKQYGT